MFCVNCGAEINKEHDFCPKCGNKKNDATKILPSKSPVSSHLIKLAIFIGFGFLFGFLMYASGW